MSHRRSGLRAPDPSPPGELALAPSGVTSPSHRCSGLRAPDPSPPGELALAPSGVTSPSHPASSVGAMDAKVLDRVRALLAKAESTSYEEEADAFTAKAHQLMSRYAIDAALPDRGRSAGGAASRRLR